MRPGALTQAARSAAPPREAAASRRPPRSAAPSRQRSGPAEPLRRARPPRRVSGPARPAQPARSARTERPGRPADQLRARLTAAAAVTRAGSIALPLPLPSRRERAAKPAGGLARRFGAWLVSLPGHPWLDRLVRGRAWIPVLGILLAGIVAAQVEILKLGASMGQALEQTTTLTTQNEQLRGSVAALGDDQRIERLASAMGMVLPPPGAVGYLAVGPTGDVAGALANIHSPDPSAFVGLAPVDGDGALITGPGTSTLAPIPGAPAPPPAATTSSTSTTTSTGTQAASGTPATTTPVTTTLATTTPATTSQAPANTSGVQGTTSQTQATVSGAPTDTGQTGSSAGAGQTTQGPATGAAALQPASSGQQSGGG